MIKDAIQDRPDRPRISFISLGCVKNLVDSEVLLGELVTHDFLICEDPKDSDVVVINTCGFLQAAEDEGMKVIGEALHWKKQGLIRGVVVAGCMPQRHGAALAERLPEVDALLGVGSRAHIVEVCRSITDEPKTVPAPTRPRLYTTDLPRYEIDRDRLRLTSRHTAYLRLSEGCNHTCAFCIIPAIKGKFRSKPMEVILDEARELARDGAVELNLIAQDTTNYGLDLYRRLALPELLNRLAEIDGVRWIRLLYCYPSFVTEELIDTVAANPRVVKYMDMPIQHTRERMLRLMRRGITQERQMELIDTLRQRIPGLVLRTTVIVGFPGETEEDFNGMMDDLKTLQFDRLGAFRFSPEPGTRAWDMEQPVPDNIKEERYDAVMRLQQSVAFQRNQSRIGTVEEVLVDKPAGRSRWIGRTAGDAPDIDASVMIMGDGLKVGNLLPVRITGSKGYDLIAKPEPAPAHAGASLSPVARML